MASARTFTDLVRGQAVAVQASAAGLVDFTVGSIPRAIAEAVTQVALWLQGLVLALLASTRAATSAGGDLDSWMADYGLSRLAAQPAIGSVTFSRFTATGAATVPFGAAIATADGSQTFHVVADSTNSAYTPVGYVMAPGTASVTVPAVADASAAAGNALSGTVTLITQALAGIDTVTNALAFAGGLDAETDAAFRARFPQYLASLARATPAAIAYAISSLRQGVTFTLVENQAYAGGAQLGFLYVVADDGTGSPSSDFLASVAAAVGRTRGAGVQFAVYAPVVSTVAIAMTLAVDPTYSKSAVASIVHDALASYVNGLGLGGGLPFSRLAQVAYDASPGVVNVTAVSLAGGTSDIAGTPKQTIKPGAITVSAP